MDTFFAASCGRRRRGNSREVLAASLLAGAAFVTESADAGDVSAIATVTSEYIYRGMTLSDGNPAVQAGVDYQNDSGLFAGVWSTSVDLDTAAGRRDLEVDYYAGWRYRNEGRWTAAVTGLRYSYPGSTGEHRYDHNEWLLSASWNDRWSAEFAYTSDLFGHGGPGRHWQVGTEWPIRGWVVGATLGGNEMAGIGAPHYLHWNLGGTARLGRFSVDLRWYDNERLRDDALNALLANETVVLSVSASL